MRPILYDLARWLALGAVALIIFMIGLGVYGAWYDEWSGYNASAYASDGVCTIAIIPLEGQMSTYPYYDESGDVLETATLDDFVYQLRRAERDVNIEGVIVSIDSPGGSPYAGEGIANELLRSSLPSAAVIRDVGASAGYWAATGADRIFASAVSNVGSIGATMSYLEYAQQNEDNGVAYIEIASGPYKDSGDPDKFLSEEEQALFQRDINILHEEFVAAVAANRGMNMNAVAELADGSTLPGRLALPAGLIDEIGDREGARAWFAQVLEKPIEEVILCD